MTGPSPYDSPNDDDEPDEAPDLIPAGNSFADLLARPPGCFSVMMIATVCGLTGFALVSWLLSWMGT